MVKPLGNKGTEKDLRDYLATQQFYANSARVHELELVGIERPGWVQYFRCHVEAKHEQNGWTELYGVIRDDERSRFDVHLFDDASQQQEAIDTMTAGCLSKPGVRTPDGEKDRVGLVPVLGALAIAIAVGILAMMGR